MTASASFTKSTFTLGKYLDGISSSWLLSVWDPFAENLKDPCGIFFIISSPYQEVYSVRESHATPHIESTHPSLPYTMIQCKGESIGDFLCSS